MSLFEHPEEKMLVFLPETLVECTRERPILCLLLMLGTLWLGYALYLIKRRYGSISHFEALLLHLACTLLKTKLI